MGLIFKENLLETGVLGVWESTEPDIFFEERIDFYPEELEELTLLKARKRSEWLSSRYLLHVLSERNTRGACVKDQYGKPYLKDSPYHISISHTHNFTAVIGSSVSCGIDIQHWVEKISRIAKRFISEAEFEYIDMSNALSYYHALWGAKEAMYKSYGIRSLDFRADMRILPFIYRPEGFFFEGMIQKGSFNKNYTLFCRQIDQLVLVYALQKD